MPTMLDAIARDIAIVRAREDARRQADRAEADRIRAVVLAWEDLPDEYAADPYDAAAPR